MTAQRVPPFRSRRLAVAAHRGVVDARYSAEFLLAEIAARPAQREFLIPSYVAALSAGLEALINDIYIEHLYWRLGEKYRDFLRPFLMLNVRDRFRLGVVIASDYRFILNESEPSILRLFELFELRNRLLHVKHYRKMAQVFEVSGNITSVEVENPDHDDFYGFEYKKTITLARLREHMGLFNILVPAFYDLGSRLKRKNFNPRSFFVALKPGHRPTPRK